MSQPCRLPFHLRRLLSRAKLPMVRQVQTLEVHPRHHHQCPTNLHWSRLKREVRFSLIQGPEFFLRTVDTQIPRIDNERTRYWSAGTQVVP